MTRPLQLAFIGGAADSIIGTSHQCAATLDGHFEIFTGCFSRNQERSSASGAAFGVPAERCYSHWQDMLNAHADQLDAVAILTPTPDHCAMLKALIPTGLAIICEKPMVSSAADAREIRELQKVHDAFIAVTFNYNAYPMVRELRQRVSAGHLGELWQYQMEMPQASMAPVLDFDAAPSLRWRIEPDPDALPTVLGDLGSHAIDMVRFTTGQLPTQVFASMASHNPNLPDYLDDARLLLRYESGLHGSIWSSSTATGNRHDMRLRLYGSEAGAAWLQDNPEEIHLSRINGQREIIDRASPHLAVSDPGVERMKPGHPAGFIEAFANLYADFATCLRQGQQYSALTSTVEQSLAGLEIMEAAMRSHHSGSWELVTYG